MERFIGKLQPESAANRMNLLSARRCSIHATEGVSRSRYHEEASTSGLRQRVDHPDASGPSPELSEGREFIVKKRSWLGCGGRTPRAAA